MGCNVLRGEGILRYEQQYLNLVNNILTKGDYVEDRTNTGTYSQFGGSIKLNLADGFPILTTKKINPVLPFGELLWMLAGKTDLKTLRKYQNKGEGSNTIWSADFEKYAVKPWVIKEEGGNIYGKQIREYGSVTDGQSFKHDQLTTLIDNIKAVKEDSNYPMARRLICSWWNPYDHTVGDKVTCALPACHTDFQCLVREGKLSLRFSMRSSDCFLGLPFNFSFYGLLCHVLAKLTGLEVGELLYFGTDVHIYSNHIEQVTEQLTREIRPLPKLVLPEFSTLEELLALTGGDFKLEGYDPHPFIRAPQAS
tara:strand:- start:458 stop:1384 length:927 start_codon:yes stop_codon:yes gene_type:complete